MKAHLSKKHEQYPSGFPERLNDDLLGHWETPSGTVVVEDHPHGYEIHIYPCCDFDGCDACSPATGDGHDFRECPDRRGPIFTVVGGEEGYRSTLQYLAEYGSAEHVETLAKLLAREEAEVEEQRAQEAAENESAKAEEEAIAPSLEERLSAAEAELAELRSLTSGSG